MQYHCIFYKVQWMSRGLGMCQGQSTTFFLCVPKYIPTKYSTIHTAIIIYDALTNQSAPFPWPSREWQSAHVHLPSWTWQSACLSLLSISTYIHTTNNNAPNYKQYYCILQLYLFSGFAGRKISIKWGTERCNHMRTPPPSEHAECLLCKDENI